MGGGILLVSIISFHTIESVQSADVVGNSLIELILYKPSASQARLHAAYTSLGIFVSSSKLAKAESIVNRLVKGVSMAMLVILILNMFKVLPDIYIMNAFIRICCPGLVAIDIALLRRFANSLSRL